MKVIYEACISYIRFSAFKTVVQLFYRIENIFLCSVQLLL